MQQFSSTRTQQCLCCKLKNTVAHYYHPPQTWSRNKISLLQVELASTFFNKFFQLATTKFCCVTMFEVGGNTCNNAFQLAMQQCCVASCSNLLLVLLHRNFYLHFSNIFSPLVTVYSVHWLISWRGMTWRI